MMRMTNCTSYENSFDLHFESPFGAPVFLLYDVNENFTEYRQRAISYFTEFGINITNPSGYDITFSRVNPDFPYFVYSAHGDKIKGGIPSSNIKVFQDQFAISINDQNGIPIGETGVKLFPGQTVVYGELRFFNEKTNQEILDKIIFKTIRHLDPTINGYMIYCDLQSEILGNGFAIGASVIDLEISGSLRTVASVKLNFPRSISSNNKCVDIQKK